MNHRITALSLALLAVAWIALGGCGTYQLRGVVVDGPRSAVELVDADDPRLNWQPLSNVSVLLMLDPDSAGRRVVGRTTTGGDGTFTFAVDEVGAGFLEYEIALAAEAEERKPAMRQFMLPGGEKRVLVMLNTGRGRLPPMDDPIDEAERDLQRYAPR